MFSHSNFCEVGQGAGSNSVEEKIRDKAEGTIISEVFLKL